MVYLAADCPLLHPERCYYTLGHCPGDRIVLPHVSSSSGFRVFPQFDSVANIQHDVMRCTFTSIDGYRAAGAAHLYSFEPFS